MTKKQVRQKEERTFVFTDIKTFLNDMTVKTGKTNSRVVVHDLSTELEPQLGFSIKSMLGGSSTLFNFGDTTNFIYEVVGPAPLNVDKINAIETNSKIAKRIFELKSKGFKPKFRDIQSKTLKLNLQFIDANLPEMLAEMLLIKYSNSGVALLSGLLERLKTENPLNFDLSKGHPFYEYKIKNFLTCSALGMTPAKLWTGLYDATGGIIIVKEDGDLVCYHIYNRNEFQDYLLNNTQLEQASTTRYNFGDLYRENGKVFFKLNLQVCFSR